MKIELERSGGFTGISKRVTVDTKKLPKNLAKRLESYLINNTEKQQKPGHKMKYRLADCYTYKISGQIGAGKVELNFNEFELTKDLKSAVNYILENY